MRALVYHGPGVKAWEDVPKPGITADTDAIVRVDCVTICGTDLHILKGDVPAVTDGRILGHEAVGTVEAVGSGVRTVSPEPAPAGAGPSPLPACRAGGHDRAPVTMEAAPDRGEARQAWSAPWMARSRPRARC